MEAITIDSAGLHGGLWYLWPWYSSAWPGWDVTWYMMPHKVPSCPSFCFNICLKPLGKATHSVASISRWWTALLPFDIPSWEDGECSWLDDWRGQWWAGWRLTSQNEISIRWGDLLVQETCEYSYISLFSMELYFPWKNQVHSLDPWARLCFWISSSWLWCPLPTFGSVQAVPVFWSIPSHHWSMP